MPEWTLHAEKDGSSRTITVTAPTVEDAKMKAAGRGYRNITDRSPAEPKPAPKPLEPRIAPPPSAATEAYQAESLALLRKIARSTRSTATVLTFFMGLFLLLVIGFFVLAAIAAAAN